MTAVTPPSASRPGGAYVRQAPSEPADGSFQARLLQAAAPPPPPPPPTTPGDANVTVETGSGETTPPGSSGASRISGSLGVLPASPSEATTVARRLGISDAMLPMIERLREAVPANYVLQVFSVEPGKFLGRFVPPERANEAPPPELLAPPRPANTGLAGTQPSPPLLPDGSPVSTTPVSLPFTPPPPPPLPPPIPVDEIIVEGEGAVGEGSGAQPQRLAQRRAQGGAVARAALPPVVDAYRQSLRAQPQAGRVPPVDERA